MTLFFNRVAFKYLFLPCPSLSRQSSSLLINVCLGLQREASFFILLAKIMRCVTDLRYVVPPLISIILYNGRRQEHGINVLIIKSLLILFW
jgi:hypothetical protein